MERGITAASRHDAKTAISFFDAVLAREPEHTQALLLRGQMARESGHPDQAAEFWRRVPDVPAADGSKARYLEGTLFIERFHSRQAERALLRAFELNPQYVASVRENDLLVGLYVLQQRGDDIRRRLQELRKVRKWSLDELVLYAIADDQIENAEQSIPALQKFVAGDPDDLFSLVALAKCLAFADRYDEAFELLRAEILKRPGETRLPGLLAELYLRRADLAAAAEVLKPAPPGSAADATLWRSHGLYAAAVQDWDRARICLQRAVSIDPNDLSCVYKLGLALRATGRQGEADRWLEQGKRLEQFQSKVLLLVHRGRRPPRELVPIAIDIARLLSELERPVEALPWVEQSLEWRPQDAAARALRATLLETVRSRPPVAGESLQHETDETVAAVWNWGGDSKWRQAPRPAGASAAASGQSRIVLRDCHAAAGVKFEYFNGAAGSKYLLETLGGGVAVLDYDGDGWPDLYFTQGTHIPPDPDDRSWQDRLFRNRGDGTFDDVTLAAGLGDNRYSQGCAAGDIDNDGDIDLVVANWGENSLYLNNGDGTFVEASRAAGLRGKHWSSSLALADFDRDGNLDLYVVNYMLEPLKTCRTSEGRIATCHPGNYAGEQDVLYHNLGNGRFADVSESAGILAPFGKGLGVLVADLDDDGWPDIYVANDGTPNFLFRNTGGTAPAAGLHFVEQGMTSGAAVSGDGMPQGSMGIAGGDLNGDGLLDLYVTNFYFEASALYFNLGNLTFTDAVRSAKLYDATRPMVGFGTQAVDFDLDGRLDLFAANGHIDDFGYRGEPWKMSPQLFRNLGEGRFADVSREGGAFFHGQYLGRGVARVDWDRDGKPDLVVGHLDRPAALLHNETESAGNSLSIELHGTAANRDALGARIRATVAGVTQVHEICGGDGYFASNERRQTIGLGTATRVELLEIIWPGGRIQRWTDVPAGGLLSIVEGRDWQLVDPLLP
jgi:tetratricopeptide (TPR) repeat protein